MKGGIVLIYNSLTADPKCLHSQIYEIMPNSNLSPFVRCFWTNNPKISESPKNQHEVLIIPDTCVDIIFVVDYEKNYIEHSFCGISNKPMYTENDWCDANKFVFAIRFYAWTVSLFAEDSMENTLNQFCDSQRYFSYLQKQLIPYLSERTDFLTLVSHTQAILLKKLNRIKTNSTFFHTINEILYSKGNISMKELSKKVFICQRTIQRIFKQQIGIPPKQLASLIRFQFMWQDMATNPLFDIQNAVLQYGFSDQAHLLNSFKKYHSMTPVKAINYMYNHVAFLQDKYSGNSVSLI